MTATPSDPAAPDLGGAVPARVLRAGDKSLLTVGHRDGDPVVIKQRRGDEGFWRDRFTYEISVYQAFTHYPPPVRVPALAHTDGDRVLVVEYIPGRVVDTERHPRPLDRATVDLVVDTVTAFGRWNPPPGVLVPVFDYADRVERYHRGGFLDTDDRDALRTLLAGLPPPGVPAHGDPLPSNLLLTPDGACVLLDFEFTGLFLPGFDLAMLHTLLADTPEAQAVIDTVVAETGIEAAFLVNQAMVLSRELRLHTELPPGEFREQRLSGLRPLMTAWRARLHGGR